MKEIGTSKHHQQTSRKLTARNGEKRGHLHTKKRDPAALATKCAPQVTESALGKEGARKPLRILQDTWCNPGANRSRIGSQWLAVGRTWETPGEYWSLGADADRGGD